MDDAHRRADRQGSVHTSVPLPWPLQLAPFWEATYNDVSAEADDDGLVLAHLLGGTSDWHKEAAARSSGV
ncbi:hypothetical protein [Streptomyces marianii]|uniref:Uncharacterized protein n=1 Tax=Streptomyces marianii TaxID=1817406 RepID=A0A5R9E6N7_9ACTN|nr:hypothetical protein [Streptomyces marianii]TLQ44947.1 hypothetical protein FEF34_19390 [Streptomyces marianii]